MTPLSKIKTLIDYAKFGVSVCKIYNKENGSMFFPRLFKTLYFNFRVDNIYMSSYATEIIAPYSTTLSGNKAFVNNTNLTKVYAPQVTTLEGTAMFDSAKALKEVYFPSLKSLASYFLNCESLEVLEVGALNWCNTDTFSGCTRLHTLIVGKDTNCNLYLHHSEAYTQECLHNIIDNLKDRTGTTALTLQIGSVNIAKVSDEYKTKLSNKNWNLA